MDRKGALQSGFKMDVAEQEEKSGDADELRKLVESVKKKAKYE